MFFELLRRVLGNMEFATPTLFYFSIFIKVDLHIFAYKTSFQTHSLSDFLQKPLLKVVRSRLRTRALRELGSCGFILHHAYGIRTRDILISCETLLFFLKQWLAYYCTVLLCFWLNWTYSISRPILNNNNAFLTTSSRKSLSFDLENFKSLKHNKI